MIPTPTRQLPFAAMFVLAMAPCHTAAAQMQAAAGTYRISVCKSAPCSPDDSSNAVAWGTLVLGDTALALASLPASVARQLTLYSRAGALNGCYVMSRVRRHTRTDAGTGGLSATEWTFADGNPPTITTSLFRTSDAAHRMVVSFDGGRLNGWGTSHGMGVPVNAWGRDTIVGRRIGPADYSRCVNATSPAQMEPRAELGRHFFMEWTGVRDATQRHVIFIPAEVTGNMRPPSEAALRSRAAAVWDPGSVVMLHRRTASVTGAALVDTIATWVRRLRDAGISPRNITVAGAGDAASAVAMVSALIPDSIGYVLLGGCAQFPAFAVSGQLHGEVVSLLHQDAPASHSCSATFASSPQLARGVEHMIVGTTGNEFYHGTSPLWTDLLSDWVLFRRLIP